MLKTQFVIAAALFAGVAIGYFARPSSEALPVAEETHSVAKKQVTDKGDAASVRALRARLADLEKQLAQKNETSEVAVVGVAEQKEASPHRPRRNPREWLENLKKNDPARYAQVTNGMARWRMARAEAAQSKIDFFASIDVSHMSAGAQKTHRELQELIARREEIEEQIHQEGLSDEERDTLMKEMWNTQRELERLNGEERQNLIAETVRTLGFGGEDAQEISATIQDIIQATDSRWRHRASPPGGRQGGR